MLIVDGSGMVKVGENDHEVSAGDRVGDRQGVFHGDRTGGVASAFLSVQSPLILDAARGTLDLEKR